MNERERKIFVKPDRGEHKYTIPAFGYLNKPIQRAFNSLDATVQSAFIHLGDSGKEILPKGCMDLMVQGSSNELKVLDSIVEKAPDSTSEQKGGYKQEAGKTEIPKEKELTQADTQTSLSITGGRNFGLTLVAKRRYYDEAEVAETRYGFEIVIDGETVYREVKAADIESFSWLRKATDSRAFLDVTMEQMDFKKYVHNVLEEGYANLPWEYRYKQCGWKKFSNGKLFYVCDSGIVGQTTKDIRSGNELRFEIASDHVGTQETFNEFYGMQQICRNVDFSRMLMIYASLSVLTTIFEKAGFPVKFLVGVLGTTNTLKTSSVLVFSKIFNALTTDSPEVTFMSTMGGIETQVAKFQDAILLVDDFMPAESRKKQSEQNSKLELLCRLYGDRTSKKRMSAYSGQDVEFPVRGCCIFTGELLTGVESSRTRILQLKLQRGQIDQQVLAYYQKNPLILPTYLYGFIEFVQEKLKNVMSVISEQVQNYRAAFQYSIARLNECQAILFTMVDLMIWYWTEKNYIASPEEILVEWRQSIQNIVEENQRLLTSHSLLEMILSALLEKIFAEPHKLREIDKIVAGQSGYVYEDADLYYIRSNDLYVVAKDFCKRYDFPLYFQKNIMLAQLKESGVLEVIEDEKGHIQTARKLQQGKGITQRFLYIKKKKINEILNQND